MHQGSCLQVQYGPLPRVAKRGEEGGDGLLADFALVTLHGPSQKLPIREVWEDTFCSSCDVTEEPYVVARSRCGAKPPHPKSVRHARLVKEPKEAGLE